jgi:hypothetical protein
MVLSGTLRRIISHKSYSPANSGWAGYQPRGSFPIVKKAWNRKASSLIPQPDQTPEGFVTIVTKQSNNVTNFPLLMSAYLYRQDHLTGKAENRTE